MWRAKEVGGSTRNCATFTGSSSVYTAGGAVAVVSIPDEYVLDGRRPIAATSCRQDDPCWFVGT